MNKKVCCKLQYLHLRQELFYDNKKYTEETSYNKGYFNTILLFLTWACNLKCPWCFNIEQLWLKYEMDLNYIKKIVENNPKIDKYDLMWWEPLLHPKFDDIIKYLESKNKKIWLYTNWYLLDKLNLNYKNLKVNIASHSIISDNKSNKPLVDIIDKIKKISKYYPLKLVFLLTNENKLLLKSFIKYAEDNLDIKKITIWTIRDESDYYNDNKNNILPISEYIEIVQDFINTYNWKLDIDIFTEWVLYTKSLPQSQKEQLNRFRCIYKWWKMTDCLYHVWINNFKDFDINKEIKYNICSTCPETWLRNCLTDKIKLRKLIN